MVTAQNSGSAGYLLPDPGPLYDQDLEDLFQQVIVGITGLQGNLVRPRWQIDPPNLPPVSTDWCAFGVVVQERMWNAYQWWDNAGSAYVVEGSEPIDVTFSFYGPNNQRNRRSFTDGIMLDQNREDLGAQKIKLIEFRDPVNLPALLKEQWGRRVDVKAVFHRWVTRTFPVQTLIGTSPPSGINNEKFVTPIVVNPPTT